MRIILVSEIILHIWKCSLNISFICLYFCLSFYFIVCYLISIFLSVYLTFCLSVVYISSAYLPCFQPSFFLSLLLSPCLTVSLYAPVLLSVVWSISLIYLLSPHSSFWQFLFLYPCVSIYPSVCIPITPLYIHSLFLSFLLSTLLPFYEQPWIDRYEIWQGNAIWNSERIYDHRNFTRPLVSYICRLVDLIEALIIVHTIILYYHQKNEITNTVKHICNAHKEVLLLWAIN